MAGDGESDRKWSWGCSPGIFASRALPVGKHMPIDVNLCERGRNNYLTLRRNLSEHLPPLGYVQRSDRIWVAPGVTVWVRWMNSEGFSLEESLTYNRRTAVFIQQDPNTMSDLVLPQGYTNRRNYWQTSFYVLGCNVGGMYREATSTHVNHQGTWIKKTDRVRSLLQHRSVHQDVAIAQLVDDDARFAYALVTARSAMPRSIEALKKGFSRYGLALDVCSYDAEPARFTRIMKELLLL